MCKQSVSFCTSQTNTRSRNKPVVKGLSIPKRYVCMPGMWESVYTLNGGVLSHRCLWIFLHFAQQISILWYSPFITSSYKDQTIICSNTLLEYSLNKGTYLFINFLFNLSSAMWVPYWWRSRWVRRGIMSWNRWRYQQSLPPHRTQLPIVIPPVCPLPSWPISFIIIYDTKQHWWPWQLTRQAMGAHLYIVEPHPLLKPTGGGGVSLRPSVRPASRVRSVVPRWIHFIFIHLIKQFQKVCRV